MVVQFTTTTMVCIIGYEGVDQQRTKQEGNIAISRSLKSIQSVEPHFSWRCGATGQ